MKEQNSIQPPAALAEIPMLAEYDDELAEPPAQPVAGMTAQERRFGVYSANELVQPNPMAYRQSGLDSGS